MHVCTACRSACVNECVKWRHGPVGPCCCTVWGGKVGVSVAILTRESVYGSLLLFWSQKWSGLKTHINTLTGMETACLNNFCYLIKEEVWWQVITVIEIFFTFSNTSWVIDHWGKFEEWGLCLDDSWFCFSSCSRMNNQSTYVCVICVCLSAMACLSLCSVCVLNPEIIPYSSSHPPHLQP